VEQPIVAAGSPALKEIPVQLDYTNAPTGVLVAHESLINDVIVVGNTPWFYGPNGIYRLSLDELIPIEVNATAGDPRMTGAVIAATQWGAEALFIAEQGFFQTFEGHLITSPLTTELSAITPLDIAGAQDGSLWVGATDGLYHLSEGTLSHVSYSGADIVSSVANAGKYVVAAYDGQTMVLDTEAFVWLTGPAVTLTELHAADTRVLGASEHGLYIYEENFDWVYRPTSAVSSVDSNPLTGQLYATTNTGVIAFEPDAAWHEANTFAAVSVGADGNPWIVGATSLEQLVLGEVTSFTEDIAPILDNACAGCHSDGYSAPLRDFTDYGTVTALFDTMYSRISTGQMPPGGGLSEDQIQAISDWYAGGFVE